MPMRKTYKSYIIINTTASCIELWSQKFYILLNIHILILQIWYLLIRQ